MAGIIGAVGNNGMGITGVCWKVSLVPLQTSYDSAGHMEIGDVNNAIQYACNNNIPIINCSFRWYEESNSFAATMSNYKGLIVCGAGNEGNNIDITTVYPASSTLDNVLTIACVDEKGEWWEHSNYGFESVDIAACGTNIKSSFMNTCIVKTGTSMATPFVSATAALMLSYRPDLDAATLKEIILKTGTYTPALKDKVATSRILNIYKAVYEVCKISPPAKAVMGDVDGDGRDDIVSIGKHNSGKQGYVYIQFANSSSGYKSAVCVSTRKNVNYNDDIWLEDINGDGMDDLVCRVGEGQWDTGYIYVALSLKTKFDIWTYNSNGRVVSPYDEILFGDVDGNGKQDIICRGAVTQHDEGKMYTALSYGNGFTFWSYESSSKIVNQGDRLWVGDVNGDKKDDIVCEGDFSKGDAGCIYIALSDGKKFTFWSNKTLIQRLKNVDDKVWVEDVNNDGRADLIVQTGLNAWDTGYIWIALSNVNGFNFWTWHSGAKVVSETDEVMPADINGDGKTDLVVRGGFGKWDAGYIWTALSNGSSFDFWTFHTTYKVVYPRDQILIGKINSDLCDDILTVRGYGYTDAGTMRTAVSNKKSFNFWTWIGGKIGV